MYRCYLHEGTSTEMSRSVNSKMHIWELACTQRYVSGTFTILVISTVVRTQTAKPFGHYNQSKFNVNRKEPNDRHTPHDWSRPGVPLRLVISFFLFPTRRPGGLWCWESIYFFLTILNCFLISFGPFKVIETIVSNYLLSALILTIARKSNVKVSYNVKCYIIRNCWLTFISLYVTRIEK